MQTFKILEDDFYDEKITIDFKGTQIVDRRYRVQAVCDFGDVKAGELGGYLSKRAKMEQGCWIGDGVQIFAFSHIKDNSVIKGNVILKNSIINDSKILADEHFGMIKIKDSALYSVNLTGGAKIKNSVLWGCSPNKKYKDSNENGLYIDGKIRIESANLKLGDDLSFAKLKFVDLPNDLKNNIILSNTYQTINRSFGLVNFNSIMFFDIEDQLNIASDMLKNQVEDMFAKF